jgi:DmsE family decaheme c-type cytochrome
MRRTAVGARWTVVASCLVLAGAGQASAQAPGAECAGCHGAVVKAFAANPHARTAVGAAAPRCDSCHAGAAEHAQDGDPAKVRSFRTLEEGEATATCQECHGRERGRTFWKGSPHDVAEVGCTSCHSVHAGHRGLLARPAEKETCFTCHYDVRADTLKRSAHPLRDASSLDGVGVMSCSSCHNTHGARSKALVDARSVNDKCFECHTEKRAPVVWEHSPVKEDCLICHSAHGSSNDNLLVAKVPRLCQECHMQGRHQSGTLAQNSVFAFNRSCLNCHPQVHGSNSPSGAVLQR